MRQAGQRERTSVRSEFQDVICFLLGNSPASEFQTPGNYPEESIQHSEQGESLKSRVPRFYSTLRIISYFRDQAINTIILKRTLYETGGEVPVGSIRYRTGAIKHGINTAGCITREKFLEKLSKMRISQGLYKGRQY